MQKRILKKKRAKANDLLNEVEDTLRVQASHAEPPSAAAAKPREFGELLKEPGKSPELLQLKAQLQFLIHP